MHADLKPFLSGVLILVLAGVCCADDKIEEIFVVAQKRNQPLQDVPVPVTVVTGAKMELTGMHDILDAARAVSSLTITQTTTPINTSFRLRRIGNEASIPNFEPAVGLFVDGAFRTRSGVGAGELFDIERIEILKGPQSVLYGKNTTAGLIGVITRKPTKSFEATGEASVGQVEGYGTADMVRVSAAAGGPVSDAVSARFSGSWFDHGTTMKNLFVPDDSQDMNRYSLRGQALYAPSDRVEARLILNRFVIDSAHVSEFEIDEGIALATTNAAFGVSCPQSTPTDRAFCNNRAVVTDIEADDATFALGVDFGDYEFSSVTGYEEYTASRDLDADQLNLHVLDLFDRQSSESFSQELRILSPEQRDLAWLGGIYYYSNDYLRGDPVLPTAVLGDDAPLLLLPTGDPFGQPGDAGILTSRTGTDHFSIFGNLTWRLDDRFDVTAGARWQSEDKTSVIINTANHSTPTLITLLLAPPGASENLSRETDGFSWNLTGRFRWSPSFMVYATASRGFKSGGFNAGFQPTPGATREFVDETVRNVELGAKSVFADERVRLNASIFYAEYDDFQSAGFVSLRFRVNNAERVSVAGVELDTDVVWSDSLTFSASVSYADAKYDRYTGGACYFNRLPDSADGTACVLSGSALPLAPKWKTWADLEFMRPMTIGDFHTGVDWTWVDRHYTNATLDPRHVQGPYSLFNLRAGLRFDPFDVFLWINNIGDETIVMQAGPTNLFGGDPAFAQFLGAARSYGVTMRANW